jgi:hypothetical protein
MFKSVNMSSIIAKKLYVNQVRLMTSMAAKQKSAKMYPMSKAYTPTPSDLAVIDAGLVVMACFGLQIWNCSATTKLIRSG